VYLCAALLAFGVATVFWSASVPAWQAAAAMLAAACALDAGLVRLLPAAAAERAVPGSLALGAWHRIRLRIRNLSRRALRVAVFDHHPAKCEMRGLPQSARIGPQAWAELEYELKPLTRGELGFGPIELRVRSPLALWQRRLRLGTPAAIRVYPNFAALSKYALFAADQRLSQIGVLQRPRRGEGLEFHQLREYREGDAQRQIDWKATSRTGKLISREYQDERDQNIMFLIDCGRRLGAHDDALSHFDHVLNAVLLLAYVSVRQGDAAGFLTMSGHSRFMAPRKSPAAVTAMLNQLYDLQPTLSTSDYYAAAVELMVRLRKRALVVIVSNLRDEDEDTLAPALKLLSKRHLVLFASLRESILSRALKSRVDTHDRALTYAATADYLHARELAFAKLGRTGTQCLDVEPQDLPIALVNRYLDIKRARLL
jgi:uncharacterized protein (DUF58 family)